MVVQITKATTENYNQFESKEQDKKKKNFCAYVHVHVHNE